MKTKLLLIATVTACTTLLFMPSLASAVIPADMAIEPDSGPFDLYFSDEPVVEVASRYPKALSKIAENVTVITSTEIAAANVHTLAEILNRTSGMFVSFNGQDFGSSTTLYIHGSTDAHQHHTLVLLDGVKYNYASGGTAETNGIPVSIIDRVEIIKGPASSAWGSALGGVINIVTKGSGNTSRPESDFFMSYGEDRSSDIRAETKGKAGVKYYLYTGKQKSDGIRDNRYFDNQNIYGKLGLNLPRQSEMQITAFYTRPEQKFFDWPEQDYSGANKSRDFSTSANFNSSLNDDLNLSITAGIFSRKTIQSYNVLGTGLYGPAGNQFKDYISQEDNRGISSRLVRSGDQHIFAVGFEYNRTELDQTLINGPFLQGFGLPQEIIADTATEEHWAIYLNDTFEWNKLTVIPGIRYDYHSITDDFLSPSLGAVYQYRHDTLFRASVARGFSKPYLGLIGGGKMFSVANSDLEPEKIWSWQAGLETSALDFFRFKATVFFHDLRDVWSRDAMGKVDNTGRNKRLGYEIEFETLPIHDFSLSTNFTSIYEDNTKRENDHLYDFNIILTHDNPDLWRTELFGHYIWWQAADSNNGHYNDFLWDLNLSKNTAISRVPAKFFFKIHNIFNSSQYWSNLIENPGRWVEGGLTVTF